jgi:hypothetical protein
MDTPLAIPKNQILKKSKSNPLLLLFFLWPFLSFIASLWNFRKPYTKIIFILFCIFFGLTFIVPANKEGVADSFRYAQVLINMHKAPLNFENVIAEFYSKKTNTLDIYQPLVTWVVSLITNNPHILFAVFALVFGYFYANNLWIVLTRIRKRFSFPLLVFILVLALINPIWNINGVRMYTAAQIFIYGSLLYFLEGNKKGLWWTAISCLVHFSFLFPLALLLIFMILPKKLTIFFIFFIFTSFISEVNLVRVRESLSILPEVFQYRVNSYTDANYAESYRENRNEATWHVKLSGNLLKWIEYILITVIYFICGRSLKKDMMLYILFCFALFVFGCARIGSLIPSGGRFLIISDILIFVFFILFFTEFKTPSLVNTLKLVAIPFLLFYCIFSIRIGFSYMGISTLVGNPISAFLIEDTKPLIEFVKSLF